MGIAAIALITAAVFYFRSSPGAAGSFTVVKRGNLTEIVRAGGIVKPAKSVDLAFQNGGKINYVGASVGNFVSVGEVIASTDSADLSAQRDKAKADLATQQAMLNKMKIDLNNQYGNIFNNLNIAFTEANDAVRNQADNMFNNSEQNSPALNFLTMDSQAQTDAQNGRLLSGTMLNEWRKMLNQLIGSNPSQDDLYAALAKSNSYQLEIQNFLLVLTSAMNKAYNMPQAALDVDKNFLSAANSEINSSITLLTAQKQAIDSQAAAVDSQKSNVKSYEANVENIKAQIGKTVIYSPINGIVSRQDAKTGQIVSPGAISVSIISSSQFQVEEYVPESDVAKIKIGNDAALTLDAYGSGANFAAKVFQIDPAASLINNVPAYKVTLVFNKADSRVKAGMNANVVIMTGARENILAVPAGAIIARNGDKFVMVDRGSKNIEERRVGTGITGSSGLVEITSGLSEGERIISFGNYNWQ